MTISTAVYSSPIKNRPRSVCFKTYTKNKKRFVRYGIVSGSKNVRKQLDMPLSAKVYDETLKQIAFERYQKRPIRAELNVVDADENINEEDVQSALSVNDADAVQFWENNILLFGAYDDVSVSTKHSHSTDCSLIESFKQAILDDDVLREKHYFVRQSSDGRPEHLFAVACRFQLDGSNNNLYMYSTHIETGKRVISLEERNQIWTVLHERLISRPQQYVGVPDDIYFKQLCEMDGWK